MLLGTVVVRTISFSTIVRVIMVIAGLVRCRMMTILVIRQCPLGKYVFNATEYIFEFFGGYRLEMCVPRFSDFTVKMDLL
jgi:hypothetical protein